jgi:hypothetical protein
LAVGRGAARGAGAGARPCCAGGMTLRLAASGQPPPALPAPRHGSGRRADLSLRRATCIAPESTRPFPPGARVPPGPGGLPRGSGVGASGPRGDPLGPLARVQAPPGGSPAPPAHGTDPEVRPTVPGAAPGTSGRPGGPSGDPPPQLRPTASSSDPSLEDSLFRVKCQRSQRRFSSRSSRREPAGAAALAFARPDRLAGYTDGERDVIAYCEAHCGRRLTAREIAFQIACAETVLGPDC